MSQVKSPKLATAQGSPPRRGQALVEFALTLPILLLLIFGIIEFARLFQTWVVLQSAARAGARAASIGAINYDIFEVTPGAQPLDLRVLDQIVPCTEDDDRGIIVTDPSGVQYFNGDEGLFATMYDGTNCDPGNEDHVQLRKDILRIFTVIAEVRETAGTIAVYENRVDQDYDSITPSEAFDFVKGYWNRPYKSEENAASPGWLSVEMCSTRPLLDGTPVSTLFTDSRFITVRNAAEEVGGPNFSYPRPYCRLNEVPADPTRPDALNNSGHRWFDVGGPGDRVTVFLKFNHPLITPLNLASYVPLESRRSSVNESFRAPKAVGAFQRSIPPGRDPDDPQPASWTPSITPSPTNTEPAPPTLTRTPSETPVPFSCESLEVIWSQNPFLGSQLFMTVVNNNNDPTELQYVRLRWNDKPSWQLMFAQAFDLDGAVHWQGSPPASPPQDLVDTRIDGTFYPSAPRMIGGGGSAVWSALFVNGPASLSSAFTIFDFGAEFEFANPAGAPCIIELTQTSMPPSQTPSDTPEGPPPTPTPSCEALENIYLVNGANAVYFDPFDGSARLTIQNFGNLPVYLLGFEMVWPDPTHPQVGQPAGRYHLRRVKLGGMYVDDPLAVEVWRSTGDGQDSSGNTVLNPPPSIATSSTSAEGAWLTNGVIQPGTNYLWLDFKGFTGRLSQFGVNSSHFDGTRIYIGWAAGCYDGEGGDGIRPTAVLQATLPSPTATNTPATPPTPAPTPTRTNTVPSNTPSSTPIIIATATVPTATASLTASPTPIGGVTQGPGSGGD